METVPWTPEASFEHSLDVILQYVIYDNARDFPGKYVVRQWRVDKTGEHQLKGYVCDTLEQARETVPPFLYRMGRFLNDDPAILEVWI